MKGQSHFPAAIDKYRTKMVRKRISHRGMNRITGFKMVKKCIGPEFGKINKLVGNDNVATLYLFTQTAACGRCKNILTS